MEIKEKKVSAHKKSKLKQAASVVEDGLLAEIVFDPELDPPIQFAVWQQGKITVTPSLTINSRRILPPEDPYGMTEKGVVLLPSRRESSGGQEKLLDDLRGFIHKYADLPPFWEELIAYYVLMTWVYDRFTAVPYLRFLGDHGSGKSRCLQVAAHLCYKGIVAGGATTSSPLFRLIDVYKGTFVMDEADFRNSEAWTDISKILNSGYMQGIPVLRSEKAKDTYEPRSFDVFGPKIIANRSRFADPAVESRCLTLETEKRELRSDIPRQLPPKFFEEARKLRNKLLGWRFENYHRIEVDESDLLHLEPRLTQIGTTIYNISKDVGFREHFVKWLESAQRSADLPSLQLVTKAIRNLVLNGSTLLAVKDVTEEANRIAQGWGLEEELSAKRVGHRIRSLGFKSFRVSSGFKFYADASKL